MDLRRDGYTVFRRFIGGADLDAVRAGVDELLAGPTDGACARPNNTLVPLRWNDAVVAAVLGGRRTSRLVAAAAAADLRWISGYTSVKDPHSPPLWWHQDWWCWDHPVSFERAPAQVALLCYLTDTTAGSGALRVLPGSHARSAPVHAALPQAHRDPLALHPEHEAMRDQPGQVTLALSAGDAVLMDYRLLHGTHANDSDRRRDCVILNFTPSWALLPDDVRAHLVRHPCLPGAGEVPPAGTPVTRLLPHYAGEPRDLPLRRDAPARFAIR